MEISVIIPARNEEKRIGQALDHLLVQDIKVPYEIIVVEGGSSDKTRAVVKGYMKKHKNIVLKDNPSGNTAIGRNVGLQHAKGRFVMNFSAHALAEKGTLRVLHDVLEKRRDIVAVGCANVPPKDKSFWGNCIGVVYASIFGGVRNVDQNARFDKERIVQSVAFTLYRKDALTKIGGFDPKFWCGQDFELNYRLTSAGQVLLFTPKTVVYRYNRNTIGKFAKQMYRYGIARSFIMKKHPASFRWSYVIPSLLVVYAIVGLVFSFLSTSWLMVYTLSWLVYVMLGWLSSLLVTRDMLMVFVSPFLYFIEHVFYGVGFLSGFLYQKF